MAMFQGLRNYVAVMAQRALLERSIECDDAGEFAIAQRLRYYHAKIAMPVSTAQLLEWGKTIVISETRLCELAQREEFLSTECDKLRRTATTASQLSAEEQQQLADWEEQVAGLVHEFWLQCRLKFAIEQSLPAYIIRMGYYTYINSLKNRAVNNKLLKLICSGRGGCCYRKCGCCERPRGKRLSKHGHCTIECKCCEQTRGFPLELEEEKRVVKPEINTETYEGKSLIRASIWGTYEFFF